MRRKDPNLDGSKWHRSKFEEIFWSFKLYCYDYFLTQSRYAPTSYLDEGVYVNTNGELVRHAVLQWGETPYAIGKFYLLCRY